MSHDHDNDHPDAGPDTPGSFPAVWHFCRRLLIFLLPLLLLVAALILADPLRVFRSHDNYYGDDNFLELNRELICLRTFEKNFPDTEFNAFIFGNSRSLAFLTSDWIGRLPDDARAFHFDALGDTLWGVRNKLRYLDECGVEIRHVLWAVDEELLAGTSNREGYLKISPPALSGGSPTRFYRTFLQAMLEPRLALAWLDFSLFRTHRGYMSTLIRQNPGALSMDPVTADLHYTVEQTIEEDPDAWYAPRMDIFYDRPLENPPPSPILTPVHERLLDEIAAIIRDHEADLRIVINPLYNQVPVSENWVFTLQEHFGSANVHDYSGINHYTADYRNYYETSHFRPHVARAIMNEIYLKHPASPPEQ